MLHLLHSHFELAPSEAVYGEEYEHPLSAWMARPTPVKEISLDNIRPHNISVLNGKPGPYEFRAGKWDGSQVAAQFWDEFIKYVQGNGLESVIGLQVRHGPLRQGTEVAFSTCTVMLDPKHTILHPLSIPTGWSVDSDGTTSLTVYETHTIIDGEHRRVNAGAPGNIWEAQDCLMNLRVLR